MNFPNVFLTCLALASTTNAYEAAVFEFSPFNDTSPTERLEKNAEKIASEVLAIGQKKDIVVLPEYALTSTDVTKQNYKELALEIPADINFCDTDTADKFEVLKKLSCAAKSRQNYLVVNLLEADGKYVYNTNIVFDRAGKIINKYRKMNLDLDFEKNLLEPGSDLPEAFTPDFGGYFVTITGSDITHKTPAVDIFDNPKVTEVIYPNIWYTELPFKAALSVQSGYAKRYGINLLSAGYSRPKEGNGGCGVFTPNPYNSIASVSPFPATKLISKSLTTLTERQASDACARSTANNTPSMTRGLITPPSIDKFLTKLDVPNSYDSYNFNQLQAGENDNRVCSKDNRICCDYDIKVTKLPANFSYAAMAYSDKKRGEYGCGLVSCELSTDHSTCGGRFKDTEMEIESVKLKLRDDKVKVAYYGIPSTLAYDLSTIDDYRYCVKDGEIEMQMGQRQNSIVAFGFFGKSISFGVELKANAVVILLLATIAVFKF